MKNFIKKNFQRMIEMVKSERLLDYFNKDKKIKSMSAIIFFGRKLRNDFEKLSDREVSKFGGKPIASIYIEYEDGKEEHYFIRLSKKGKVIEYRRAMPIKLSFEVVAGSPTHEYRMLVY